MYDTVHDIVTSLADLYIPQEHRCRGALAGHERPDLPPEEILEAPRLRTGEGAQPHGRLARDCR